MSLQGRRVLTQPLGEALVSYTWEPSLKLCHSPSLFLRIIRQVVKILQKSKKSLHWGWAVGVETLGILYHPYIVTHI